MKLVANTAATFTKRTLSLSKKKLNFLNGNSFLGFFHLALTRVNSGYLLGVNFQVQV